MSQAPDQGATHVALDEQQQGSWNIGEEGRPLAFPYAQPTDAAASLGWRDTLTTLAARLAPAEPRWVPYYDPTLFQSLQAPRSADLRLAMRPILSPEMDLASRRGDGLLSLFRDGGCRADVALVLDLPGPEAVAIAAALAPCFDPVFLFDNWPHPLGVVPSHLTLGATLYYLPSFEKERALRPAGAPPAFVLDRSRLAPYTDEGGRFDNRYFVGLPARAAFEAAGIRRILYVTPNERVVLESDDLNDDLAALADAGFEVRMLALSDFAETPIAGWPAELQPAPELPADAAAPDPAPPTRFFFGGSRGSHGCFWPWYGWPGPGTVSACPVSSPVPPALAPRCQFRPARRPTFLTGSTGSQGMPGPSSGGRWWRPGRPVHHGATHHGSPSHSDGPGRSGSIGRSHFGGHHSG